MAEEKNLEQTAEQRPVEKAQVKPKLKRYISRFATHVIVVEPTTKEKLGRRITFQNHRYETADPQEQQAIEKSRDFGVIIFAEK